MKRLFVYMLLYLAIPRQRPLRRRIPVACRHAPGCGRYESEAEQEQAPPSGGEEHGQDHRLLPPAAGEG